MIDIHTHVVYGVDDGSRSLEMSCQMLETAAAQGVTDIICTSHCTPGHRPFPMDDYIRHLRELQNWLNRKGIGIRLWPGCEILYTDQAASMARAREIPTLGGGDWALVEFLPETPWSTIEKAVREFGNYGIGMVAAHVERYQCLREDISLLEELSESGVMCQMNAETVARSATVLGDRWAKRALRHGLIDLVASDMHRTDWRPPNLDKAWETIRKQYGGGTASLLMEKNPGSLLPGTWY